MKHWFWGKKSNFMESQTLSLNFSFHFFIFHTFPLFSKNPYPNWILSFMPWMYAIIRSFETWNESSITELCIGDENHTWKSSLCHLLDDTMYVTQVKLFNAFLPVREFTCRWSSSYIGKLIKVVTLLKIIFYMVRKVRTLHIHPITPIKKSSFSFFHFFHFIFFHFISFIASCFTLIHKHDKNMNLIYIKQWNIDFVEKKVKLYGKLTFLKVKLYVTFSFHFFIFSFSNFFFLKHVFHDSITCVNMIQDDFMMIKVHF